MATGQLIRSTTDRKIAGVCGGVAAHFNLDPTLVRVLWALAVVAGFGAGALIYVALWIVLPEGVAASSPSSAARVAEERYARGEITADELERIKRDLAG